MTCLHLAAKGARVYMGARSSEKASEAIAQIQQQHPQANIQLLLMDHTSLATVVEAAKSFISKESRLNGLILNAGIMGVPYELTGDGFEIQMQVNYMAHWLLTYHLLPILQTTARTEGAGSARIVCVSSEGHRENPFGVVKMLYDNSELEIAGQFGRYGLSKLGNVIHAKNLTTQFGPQSKEAKEGNGEVWAASLHPGFINTQLNEINRDNASWKWKWMHPVLTTFGIMRPWDEGCMSSLFVGASPDFAAAMCGEYFDQKAKLSASHMNAAAKDEEEQAKLERWTREVMEKGGWI